MAQFANGNDIPVRALDANLSLVNFRNNWLAKGYTEIVRKYSISIDSLQGAVDAIIELLGLYPIEESGIVQPGASIHTLNLFGNDFSDGVEVMARAGFLRAPPAVVLLKVAVRSYDSDAATRVISSIDED
eukprot:gb/GEZN01008863.1/.p1 GENE.gb/GEZN01008863.1/~~gb/GEZN01008863.1/.p1  ORF type:complete len:130 (+),score=11.89 gb/GEZN01008863.1/:62-451(+)